MCTQPQILLPLACMRCGSCRPSSPSALRSWDQRQRHDMMEPRCAAALLVAAVFVAAVASVPRAAARRPLAVGLAPHTSAPEKTDTWPPTPQARRANLTNVLTLDGPFRTFLGYLQQTNLVQVFEKQAYHTDQGVTILVPVDSAFAAVKPSVLSALSRPQLKNLMMYHSLARRYELAEFEGLSQIKPVTTLAGGMYTVNISNDGGMVHVRSRWADAKIVGSVSVDAPMAIYELDRVLLPDSLFPAHPPVSATPDLPAAPPPPSSSGGVDDGDAAPPPTEAEPEPVVPTTQQSSAGVADAPISSCRGGDRFACYAAAAALAAVALQVAL